MIDYQKYIRQITLKDFGETGQMALAKASVLVIGAGGLGCPVLQYLTSMGIGRIGIVDHDVVSISNLHRQILFGVHDVGRAKAEVALERLRALNNDVIFNLFPFKITQENCLSILPDYDVIVDCSDNFETRYMINDACVLLNKPLVYGAVSAYEGQVAVFNHFYDGEQSGNYRDLYPVMPKEGEIQNCAEAGILGVLPGIIGCIQASEVVKVITNTGRPLINSLYCFSSNSSQSQIFHYRVKQYSGPKNIEEFLSEQYLLSCLVPVNMELDMLSFQEAFANGARLVDVREEEELPLLESFSSTKIPLTTLDTSYSFFEKGTFVFVCQTGKRSLIAAKQLESHFDEPRFFSLRGGVFTLINRQ